MDFRRPTLSDFASMEVIRDGDEGNVILDWDELGRPIRLVGFGADSDLSDFEIQEMAYGYYLELLYKLKKYDL